MKVPSNTNLEAALLSNLLLKGGVDEVALIVNSDKFYDRGNACIFEALSEGAKSLEVIASTLQKKGQMEYIGSEIDLMDRLSKQSFSEGSQTIAKIIHEMWVRRQLISNGIEIERKAGDLKRDVFETIADLEDRLRGLQPPDTGSVTIDKAEQQVKDKIQKRIDGKLVAIPTGFKTFDDTFGGLHQSDLIVIGSFSSNGKTATAINIMTHAGALGFKCKFYSFEQSVDQIYLRQVSLLSGLTFMDIFWRNEHTDPRVVRAMETLRGHQTRYTNKCSHKMDLLADIRQEVNKGAIHYVIIDYLQLMKHNNNSLKEGLGSIANELKTLANELNIPIVLISQLRRPEAGKTAKPRMNMLKESGDIENAADVIWLPWIPAVEPSEQAEVIFEGETISTLRADDKLMIHSIVKGRNYGLKKFKTYINDSLKISEDPVTINKFHSDVESPF